ncbi:hypothetical protein [Calothrix sp. NIES-2100]
MFEVFCKAIAFFEVFCKAIALTQQAMSQDKLLRVYAAMYFIFKLPNNRN